MAKSTTYNADRGNQTSNRDGLNKRELIVTFGSVTIGILFAEGGEYTPAEKYNAMGGGGTSASGLTEAVVITGRIHYDAELFKLLVELFQRKKPYIFKSATYNEYTVGQEDAIKMSVNFGNVVVHQLPKATHTELGGEGMIEVAFSVNSARNVLATIIN